MLRNPMLAKEKKKSKSHFQRNILTGILTLFPIWITWIVFQFITEQLSNLGRPWVKAFVLALEKYLGFKPTWLMAPWFENILAILVTIAALYFLGWSVSKVIGKKLLSMFDSFVDRIPIVQTIYGSTKKLLSSLQQEPGEVERVVLINFPSENLKTVGFVTSVMQDSKTGKDLAAVYVPTTPNPTSGYLEIVEIDQLISTDWTVDEAMTFIISGGAVTPGRLSFVK